MAKIAPMISLNEISAAGAQEGAQVKRRPETHPVPHVPPKDERPEPRILEGLAEVVFPDRWQELVTYGHVWVARLEHFSRLFVSRLLVLLFLLLIAIPFVFSFLPAKIQAAIDSPILAVRAAWYTRDAGSAGGVDGLDDLVGPDGRSIPRSVVEQRLQQYGVRRATPAKAEPKVEPKAEQKSGGWFSGLFGAGEQKSSGAKAPQAVPVPSIEDPELAKRHEQMLDALIGSTAAPAPAKASAPAKAPAPVPAASATSAAKPDEADLLLEQIKREEAERRRIAAEQAAKKKREAAAAAAAAQKAKEEEDRRIKEIIAKQEAEARAKEETAQRAREEEALRQQLEEAERAAEEAKKKRGVGGFLRGLGSAVVNGVKQGAGVPASPK